MTILRIMRNPSIVVNRVKCELITVGKKKYDPPFVSRRGYKRIYHVHIRKCAGTSLNKSIIAALGGDQGMYSRLARSPAKIGLVGGRPVVGWNKGLLYKEAFFYGFSHIPYHEFDFSSDTFRFTFLREPLERIVSHFRMLKDLEQEGGVHPAFLAEAKWARGDFTQFLQNIPRRHLENQLYMFSRSFDVDEALEKLKLLDYVGDVGSINESFIPRLNAEFDISVNYKPLRASRHPFQLTKSEAGALSRRIGKEIQFYETAREVFDFPSSAKLQGV